MCVCTRLSLSLSLSATLSFFYRSALSAGQSLLDSFTSVVKAILLARGRRSRDPHRAMKGTGAAVAASAFSCAEDPAMSLMRGCVRRPTSPSLAQLIVHVRTGANRWLLLHLLDRCTAVLMLLVACCVLLVACCLLRVACCLLLVACWCVWQTRRHAPHHHPSQLWCTIPTSGASIAKTSL